MCSILLRELSAHSFMKQAVGLKISAPYNNILTDCTGGKGMKKAGKAGGIFLAMLVLLGSGSVWAGGDMGRLEPAVDFDFVVLAKNSSTSVTADLAFPLDFQIIPVIVVGDGTGAFSASMSRSNTKGELIYIYQRFPGAGVNAFNIGISPVTLRISSAVTLGPGWAFGYVITGILFSTEKPPYAYTVSLSF